MNGEQRLELLWAVDVGVKLVHQGVGPFGKPRAQFTDRGEEMSQLGPQA